MWRLVNSLGSSLGCLEGYPWGLFGQPLNEMLHSWYWSFHLVVKDVFLGLCILCYLMAPFRFLLYLYILRGFYRSRFPLDPLKWFHLADIPCFLLHLPVPIYSSCFRPSNFSLSIYLIFSSLGEHPSLIFHVLYLTSVMIYIIIVCLLKV